MLWGMYEKTGDIPTPLLNKPERIGYIEWYIEAFFLLNSSRQTGMSVGHIPLSEIIKYGETFGTMGESLKDFCTIITGLDSAYLKWLDKKKPNKTPDKGVAKR